MRRVLVSLAVLASTSLLLSGCVNNTNVEPEDDGSGHIAGQVRPLTPYYAPPEFEGYVPNPQYYIPDHYPNIPKQRRPGDWHN